MGTNWTSGRARLLARRARPMADRDSWWGLLPDRQPVPVEVESAPTPGPSPAVPAPAVAQLNEDGKGGE